jgi:hypothetical protein
MSKIFVLLLNPENLGSKTRLTQQMCTAFMLCEHEGGTLRTARIHPVYAASTPLKRLREGFNNDFTPEALTDSPVSCP